MDKIDDGRRAALAGVGGVVVGTLIAGRAQAAPLRPPNGMQAVLDKIARTDQGFGESCLPVQAFPGTGSSVYRLTEPGSYYLNGNVLAASGQNGIEIAGDHIELDLDGYSVIGDSGAAGLPGGTGILVEGANCAVYEGSVVGFDRGVDFTHATHSMTWDVTAIDGGSVAFACGSLNQHYDNEVHRYAAGVAFLADGGSSLLEECGAFACAVGFRLAGSKNVLLSSSSTGCPSPFELGPGNAWGPVVVAQGDLSLLPNGANPTCNLVY